MRRWIAFVAVAFVLAGCATLQADVPTLHESDLTIGVLCVDGCTVTPGYWKTHSEYGPAPMDDTWRKMEADLALDPLFHEDAPFFLSGQTVYEVLWTPPRRGNAYYVLAHAYIAAKMNVYAGADASAIGEALGWGHWFFTTYAPDDVLDRSLRADALEVAGLLDAYNNGLVGPGHCAD